MNQYLVEAYHAIRVLLPAGALSGGLWALLRWCYKRWQKWQEEMVLSTFRNTDPDGPWHSAHGVVGHLSLKAAISDAPGFFPPRHKTFKHRLRVLFYRTRHAVRRAFIVPSKEKVDKVLRNLWERKLLERAGWDHTDNEFYKLRNVVG